MQKKNIIFLSVSLVLIILLGIGVSYSMWNVSVSQDTNNTAYTECFDLSITNKENNINLDNAYPISNDKGKSLTPYTFTITNTCDITTQYNINLEVLNSSTLSSKFIDVMLENNDIKEINLLSNFDNADKVNTSSIESRKLTTGILKSQETKDYSLRLWIDYNTTLEDLNNEIKSFKSKIVVVGKPINFNYTGDMVFNFDYTGSEQNFVAPVSGAYRLETWGAQGATDSQIYYGGYGGYSVGNINLIKNEELYLIVGEKGKNINNTKEAGIIFSYPNGGKIYSDGKGSSGEEIVYSSGGGSTHVLKENKLISELSPVSESLLIVSGGGGGSCNWWKTGDNAGSGGGYIGSSTTQNYDGINSTGGTQNMGGTYGGNGVEYINGNYGVGGGYTEGENSSTSGSGGGGYYGGGGSCLNKTLG